MIGPLMRSYFAISGGGHVAALLLGIFYAGANPIAAVPVESVAVDIVTPDEVPEPPKETAAETPPLPDFSSEKFGMGEKTQSTNAAPPESPPPKPQPQTKQAAPEPRPKEQRNIRQASVQPSVTPTTTKVSSVLPTPSSAFLTPPQSPSQAPPTQSPELQSSQTDKEMEKAGVGNMFGMPLTLPGGRLGGGFDAQAYDTAKLDNSVRTAFRSRLKTCASLPADVSTADKVRIVLRVGLNQDGTLAAAPALIEGSASAKGPTLLASAVNALRTCQPYNMLPVDKYDEWKVLDLTFTPQDMTGG
jgi:outer membrane biosynthesis protein TonB